MATARDLIIRAYRLSKLTPVNDVPDGDELKMGIDEFNSIINTLNVDGLWPYTDRIIDVTFTQKNIFTIGLDTGGDTPDFDYPRPSKIGAIKILIGNVWYVLGQDQPINYDNNDTFENVSSLPTRFTYRTDYPFGTIQFYNGFSSDYEGKIIYKYLLDNYDYDDVVDLPVGYYDALVYILASNLCGIYGFDNPYVSRTALSRKRGLEKNNIQIPELKLRKGKTQYNMYADRNI